MSAMRPPIPYYGGKMRVAQAVASHLPDHDHYVEPFAGALSVLLAKPPSHLETVNDIDGDLVTFWRVLRDQPEELMRLMELTPHSRAEHRAALDLDVPSDLERARRVWVQLSQGYGRRLGNTGWAFQYRGSVALSAALPRYAQRVPACAARLRSVSLECRPALEVIRDYGAHPGVLLYCDPPYMDGTRSSGGKSYRHEMLSSDAHAELADALHGAKASVVLSGYPSPLYDQLYAGWERVDISTQSGLARVDKARTEVLWSNRRIIQQDVMDFAFKGSDTDQGDRHVPA